MLNYEVLLFFFLTLLGEQICSFVEKVLSMVVLKVLYSDTYLDKRKKISKMK